MTSGVILWWNELKGYGKILDEDGIEYFVHYKSVKSTPGVKVNFQEGDKVRFMATRNDRGPLAISVETDA